MTTRQWIGDWEGDTIISKGHCGAFVTLVERKSKYTVAHVVPQKTATAVRAAVGHGLGPQRLGCTRSPMTMLSFNLEVQLQLLV